MLVRVFRNQNPDGDWPQWFMFFERERTIRAGDSHGDIVFWPLLALAQYLLASDDAAILDEPCRSSIRRARREAERATVWEHVERALQVIGARVIAGTRLAAYGHGDWNDSLQPVDPSCRERLCSAWTVTLHCQMLTTLAQALRRRRPGNRRRAALEARAEEVRGGFPAAAGGAMASSRATPISMKTDAVDYLLHPTRPSTTSYRTVCWR